MTDESLWFQVQRNSYKSLIGTADEFQKYNLDMRKNDMQ